MRKGHAAPGRLAIASRRALSSHAVKLAAALAFSMPCLLPAQVQTESAADLWLTLYGDPQDERKNLVQVRPEPTGFDQGVLLELRVSRDRPRTSFKGQRYRSYYAKAIVNCSSNRAWYLRLNYYAAPLWTGATVGQEEYSEDQAPVLFKDIPGEPYKRMIAAACKVKPSQGTER